MKKRPAFHPVSEEMRRWSALLAAEVLRWPGTRVGKMFGMQSVYRGEVVFAMLPVTRSLWQPNAISIKMNGDAETEVEKWQSLVIHSDAELTAALERLDEAYRNAR